ncbi:glycosyltransferase family 2 protein [Formosa sp. A9]|uniref:glycosyltransferase family 2 protein n=1 Tax=Formosa sp. A9 TaxID=3442641 RepID=UPI003EB83BEE
MPFTFLKYLQPTHYFRLSRLAGTYIYPKVTALPVSVSTQLVHDSNYTSALAQDYDLSWQAIHCGYIGNCETYTNFDTLPVVDNYRFARKYFSVFWVCYVLVMRLVTLHNPISEWRGFWQTRQVKRLQLQPLQESTPQGMPLDQPLSETPKVSVIIPTLNRYRYLKDVLADLGQQDYPDVEVLVVDQSDPFQADFYTGYRLDLQVQQQTEKALWLARNTAIKQAKGDYLLFFDDDSRVGTDWISKHVACIQEFRADISSGVSISQVGAKTPADYAYFKVSAQLDTGNALIHKRVFESIGLYDRQFEKQRMGDGEYGLRAYLHGFKNVSNPLAKRLHLKVGSGGLRDMGQWDAYRTPSLLDPRPVPSVLYLFRKYYGNAAARLALLKTVPFSIMPYRFKRSKPMMLVGVLLSVVLAPVVCYQVWKSWRKSSVMLREGALVDGC